MKKLFILSLTVTAMLFGAASVFAGNQGAAFLKITPGARGAGMAQAFTAISGDIQSMYYNPAGLAGMYKKEFFWMHERWVSDSNVDSVALLLPATGANIGASIIYVSHGTFDARDASGFSTGNFTAKDLAVALSYSRGVSDEIVSGLAYGVNLKYISQRIESDSAAGAALDLGLHYRPCGETYQFGLSVQNIGTTMKFIDESYEIPLTFALGTSLMYSDKILLAFDVRNRPHESETGLSLGAEYAVIQKVNFRAGYSYSSTTSSKSLQSRDNQLLPSGLAIGFGVRVLGNSKLDYAFTPVSNLGDTHHISMNISF